MEHSTLSYYQEHDEDQYEELHIDEDEEYQEDLFLQQHYGRPRHNNVGSNIGGLGLVHDDDDSEDDDVYNANHSYQNHQNRHHGVQNNFHHHIMGVHDEDTEDESGEEVEIDVEYNEVDMDQHNIQLLSGSLSVRSPFLDAIREEEDEEPVFTKPSSYPTLGSGRHFQRLSNGGSSSVGGDGFGSWGNRGSLSMALAEKQLQQQQLQQQADQQQANFNNTNQSDSSKPRGPRPPLLLGRPRSNTSSLTRITTGFDVPSSTASSAGGVTPNEQDAATIADLVMQNKAKEALRESQMSPENPIQDLEVKRVLEGAAALASAYASASSAVGGSDGNKSTDSTPLPSSAHATTVNTVSLSTSGGQAGVFDNSEPTVSFGHDTQKSIDDFFGMVKSDLDKRIQEAIHEVEQKFLHRVQKLEEHTAALAGAPSSDDASVIDLAALSKSGSLMDSLTRPLSMEQNPGGSLALRKEILSHVTEKVGDLDLRVNQMEVLVSYKLVDIESKVKDLHGAHNSIAQKVHQVAKSHKSNMQGVRAGDGVGQDTITAEEARIAGAMKPYRDIDAQGRGAEAYLEPLDGEGGVVSIRGRGKSMPSATAMGESSTDLVDASSSIVELRNELQTLGMRYQELNDGLLTDLMGQMRDAKLMLFQTVDEVDGRISKRVDRIEAEMHSKLLSEIEGRVQERVRAMEQTSARLEKCFDRMEGRLGALETVLASRRPRPESMYQLLQQQLQQQQQLDEENGVTPQHAGTFAGFSSSPSSGHRSVTSILFSGEAEIRSQDLGSTQYTRPRRRTLAENGIYSDDPQPPTTAATLPDGYNPDNLALMASPLEGFVSPAQARPIWSPSHGISTSAASHVSNIPGGTSSSVPLVASPLERGTVIGNRMGTIHPEYVPRTTYVPSTPIKDKFQNSLPTTPIKERFQAGITATLASASEQGSTMDQASRLRRVSLSSFDANSLSALKPVKVTTATVATTAVATETVPPAMSIVTTTTTTTATAATTMTQCSSSGNESNKRTINCNTAIKSPTSASSSSSSTSLLSARLNSAGIKGPSSSSSSSSSSNSNSNSGTATKTIQRAMTFDTLLSQATTATSTITKTVKTPVQGPSSYRDLLHFWKAGGSAV